MSESLRIKFGRSDRTYRFGERVTGWVMIQTPRGQECKRIQLKTFWRTHGKGNRDEGEPRVVTLHSGPLPDPVPHLFEFEFSAPPGPFTYHGRYLNVDHYVEAQVDLPWARDPKCLIWTDTEHVRSRQSATVERILELVDQRLEGRPLPCVSEP